MRKGVLEGPERTMRSENTGSLKAGRMELLLERFVAIEMGAGDISRYRKVVC